jgi:hypothetical protein
MKPLIILLLLWSMSYAQDSIDAPVLTAYKTVLVLIAETDESTLPKSLDMLNRLADLEGITPDLRDNILVTYALGRLAEGSQQEGVDVLSRLANERQQPDAIKLIAHFRKSTSPSTPLKALAKVEFDSRVWAYIRAFERIYVEKPEYRKLSDTAGYTDFSWKVEVRNNTTSPVKIDVKLEFKDQDGFILRSYTLRDQDLAAGSSRVFAEKSMIKTDLFNEVATATASVSER